MQAGSQPANGFLSCLLSNYLVGELALGALIPVFSCFQALESAKCPGVAGVKLPLQQHRGVRVRRRRFNIRKRVSSLGHGDHTGPPSSSDALIQTSLPSEETRG